MHLVAGSAHPVEVAGVGVLWWGVQDDPEEAGQGLVLSGTAPSAVALASQQRLTDGVGRVVGEVVAILGEPHVGDVDQGVLGEGKEGVRPDVVDRDRLQTPVDDEGIYGLSLFGAQPWGHHGSSPSNRTVGLVATWATKAVRLRASSGRRMVALTGLPIRS